VLRHSTVAGQGAIPRVGLRRGAAGWQWNGSGCHPAHWHRTQVAGCHSGPGQTASVALVDAQGHPGGCLQVADHVCPVMPAGCNHEAQRRGDSTTAYRYLAVDSQLQGWQAACEASSHGRASSRVARAVRDRPQRIQGAIPRYGDAAAPHRDGPEGDAVLVTI